MKQIHAKDMEHGDTSLDDFVSHYRHQQRFLESNGETSTFTGDLIYNYYCKCGTIVLPYTHI